MNTLTTFEPPKRRTAADPVVPVAAGGVPPAISADGLAARLREASSVAHAGCESLCVSILFDRRQKTVPMTISVTANQSGVRARGNSSRFVEIVPLPLGDALSVAGAVWARMLAAAEGVGLNPELLDEGLSRLIDRIARRFGCSDEEVQEIRQIAVDDQETARTCFLALEREMLDEAILRPTSLPTIPEMPDDRVKCKDCGGLSGNGECGPARQGKFGKEWRYSPMQDILRRCGAYVDKSVRPQVQDVPPPAPSRPAASPSSVKGAFKVGRR